MPQDRHDPAQIHARTRPALAFSDKARQAFVNSFVLVKPKALLYAD
jgi:hypothetical protein